MKSMSCCDPNFLNDSLQQMRRPSRMVKTGLFVMFLVMVWQPVLAEEACGLLDKVVAATEESPPFGSVVHLSLPGSECEVYGEWETSTSSKWKRYECIWSFPKFYQPLDDFENKVDTAYDVYWVAFTDLNDEQVDLWDEWADLDDDIDTYNDFIEELNDIMYSNPSVQNNPEFKKAVKSAEVELERINRWEADLERREQALNSKENRMDALEAEHERLETELDNMESRVEEQVNSEAQKLVRVIKNCLFNGDIRGSWEPFETDGNGTWTIMREERDCPYSRCEMRVRSRDEVVFVNEVYE